MFGLQQHRKQVLVALALASTYFIWGLTYLAIKFGIESFPPFLMAGIRFTVAGLILYGVMRYTGAVNPTKQQWLSSTAIGILLPAMGNGTVCYVQQTVSSSVAALSIATAPIWMAIFASLWGYKITVKEWLGIAIGLMGIVLLNVGGSFNNAVGHDSLASALLLIFAAASWSFGSVWSKHLDLPSGFMASAAQMLTGGIALLVLSALQGETWPQHISQKSWLAMLFLVVFGSLVAYSAFQYLLKTVHPLVASSNTFVNPVVAFIGGIWFANEHVTPTEFIALGVILAGVFLVLSAAKKDI